MENSRHLNPEAVPFTPRRQLVPYPPPLPPPPYTHIYTVHPPPYTTNLLCPISPPPSLSVYNIFHQQQYHLLPPLPDQTPPMEALVTPPPPPPAVTSHHNNEVRPATKSHTSRIGRPRGGGRHTYGFERGGSSSNMSSSKQERFENGGRRAYMQESHKEKHQVIPVNPHERKTSIMIKNIPYGYNRQKLMKFLDDYCYWENQKVKNAQEQFVSAYDFVYLPIDFRTKKSRGFAFVNFTDWRAVWQFVEAFNNKMWRFDGIPKTIEIACAKMQGKESLVDHFQRANFECDTDEFLPLSFNPARDGSGEPVYQSTIGNRCARRYRKHGAYNHQSL